MFRLTGGGQALPKSHEVSKLKRDSIVMSLTILDKHLRHIGVPNSVRDEMLTVWKAYRGPLSAAFSIDIEREVIENAFGILLPVLALKGDELVPGVKIFKDEEAYERDDASNIVMGDAEEPDYPEGATRENLWRKVQVVEQRVAEKKIRPNDRCPCGSNLKFKKCCGR